MKATGPGRERKHCAGMRPGATGCPRRLRVARKASLPVNGTANIAPWQHRRCALARVCVRGRPAFTAPAAGIWKRQQLVGQLLSLGLLFVSAAGAQDALSIPVSDNGEPQPAPGLRLERVHIIDTLAGTGEDGDGGDGGLASDAKFGFPRSVAADAAGNIYVADTRNHRIRKIDPSGVISTLAGTGEDGDDGDGGPASEARLCFPAGVAADTAGNVYVADNWNHRIRKIDPSGVISTLAGTGVRGIGGDGGPASQARLAHPLAVAVDSAGNVYVADSRNHRIRKIDSSGVISTFAGTGVRGIGGDGGLATRARLAQPSGIASDAAGNVYIADNWNHRIRMVHPSGVISTLGGTGARSDDGDGGPASDAGIAYPVAVASDAAGNVYVVAHVPETGNNRVRRIDTDGGISAFAGIEGEGYAGDGSPAAQAELAYPMGVGADSAGNIYIADSRNARIRVVRPGFLINVPLGSSGESVPLVVEDEGALTLGGMPVLSGSEVSSANGSLYVLTQESEGGIVATFVPEIQRVSLAGADVTLTRNEDGTWRIGEDRVENGHRHLHGGKEYVLELADGNWRLAEYTIETVAGTTHVATDGIPATSANMVIPSDVAVDPAGNVFVVEWRGHRIRKIDASGSIATIAGTGNWGYSGDGGPATEARLNHPFALAADSSGNVYVAEREGHRVRKIDTSGVITTFAGTGQWEDGGDGGPATEAPLPRPLGVAVDSQDNVYVASVNRVRRIDGDGIVTTVAGTGDRGSIGDGGLAIAARLGAPHGLAFDATGNLYVASWDSNRIRRIDTVGAITTFAGTGELGYEGDGGPATQARFHHPLGIAVDAAGNVYVGEDGGGRVRRIDRAGVVTTFAGTGDSGYGGDGGPAMQARVIPFGVATGMDGSVYLAEPWNRRVRRIDRNGTITTLAGGHDPGPASGAATDALLDFPRGVAVRPSGDVIFGEWGSLWNLDTANNVARLVLSSVEGESDLEGVRDIALDNAGNLYVAEENRHRVRRIDLEGNIAAFAGTGTSGSSGDGSPATEARLERPVGVAVDSLGIVYVADRDANRIRKIDPAGMITTLAGTGEPGSSGDGGPASAARLRSPRDIAVDSLGNVYVADQYGNRIRTVDGSGMISKFADSGIEITEGALAADQDGRLYAGGERRILRIDSSGEVSTIAGTGEDGYDGDEGPARSAQLSVGGIFVDRFGDVWFADTISRRIRVLRSQID